MNLAILQISDLHIKPGDPARTVGRAPAVISAIRARCTNMDGLLLVFSGDLAFSGKASEFALAQQFIKQLRDGLQASLGLTVLGPVIIPGNHDCNFDETGDVRPLLLRRLKSEINSIELDGEKVRQMTLPQKEFFEFERHYSGISRIGSSRLYYMHKFDWGGQVIVVHCFNTAWVSQLKEKQGATVFPPHLECAPMEKRPLLSISVFHHPYRWFDPANGKRFQRMIEQISDLAFTGHEHDGDNFVRKSSFGTEVSYIEGAAFFAKGIENGFILTRVSTETESCEIMHFIERESVYGPPSTTQRRFAKNPQMIGKFLENNHAYNDELTRFTPPFSSPNLDLLLDDIFVYPDLISRSLLDKKSTVVRNDKVLDFIMKNRLVDISGQAMSGKTTLAKKLYTDLRDNFGYVPILISGEDLVGNPTATISRARDAAFKAQYAPERLEDYIQLEPERKAMIVDDWHRSRMNAVAQAKFLMLAKKEFGIVLTIGAEQHWFESIVNSAGKMETDPVQYCTIREFGYLLREKMLSKWHQLESEYELEETDVTHKVAQSSHLLNSVVGKGLFPSFPFFILYTLQLREAQPQNIGTHGSYGHVYEAFITARFAQISKKPTDIGKMYTYLSLVAYELFRKGQKTLSLSDLATVHARFEDKYPHDARLVFTESNRNSPNAKHFY